MGIAIPYNPNIMKKITMESKYTDRRLSSASWAINKFKILPMIVSTTG
jgi:hypothetical protein